MNLALSRLLQQQEVSDHFQAKKIAWEFFLSYWVFIKGMILLFNIFEFWNIRKGFLVDVMWLLDLGRLRLRGFCRQMTSNANGKYHVRFHCWCSFISPVSELTL
jgi:hypothetical protein